jgi:hypothetical protein
MKIRKRQAAADVLTRDAALPISWKYQKPREWPTAAPPAGLQVQQQQQGRGGLESSGYNISDGRKSSSPSNNGGTVAMEFTSEGKQQQVPAGLNIALKTLVCSKFALDVPVQNTVQYWCVACELGGGEGVRRDWEEAIVVLMIRWFIATIMHF